MISIKALLTWVDVISNIVHPGNKRLVKIINQPFLVLVKNSIASVTLSGANFIKITFCQYSQQIVHHSSKNNVPMTKFYPTFEILILLQCRIIQCFHDGKHFLLTDGAIKFC